MARTLSSSAEIVAELDGLSAQFKESNEQLNSKMDQVLDAAPKKHKTLSDEEKAIFIKHGLPIPSETTDEDEKLRILKKVESQVSSIEANMHGLQQSGDELLTKLETSNTVLAGKISTLLVAFGLAIALLFFSAISSIGGCGQEKKANPVPNPAPIGVIQLDKDEYKTYKEALALLESQLGPDASLQEKRESLMINLGTIAQKKKIIDQYPNERIEVLQ